MRMEIYNHSLFFILVTPFSLKLYPVTVSGPMLNPVPKSVHFMNYLNFGALCDFFLWSICWNLCDLASVICLLI